MKLKAIADKLTTELTGVLSYIVTDDIQLFSEKMKLDGGDYVPCVVSLISPFEEENRYIKTMVYQLRFKVQIENKDNFIADMETYRDSQLTEIFGSYVVTKVVQEPIYVAKDTDNGYKYIEFTVDFTWVYTLSKVGTKAVIKIDTVQVPFTDITVTHDISYVVNQSTGSNYRMTNDVIAIDIPLIISNTKVLELYNYINSDSHNQTYALDIDGITKTVILKQGIYNYTNASVLAGMTLIFETHYPRVVITLDTLAIPVTSYRYHSKGVVDTAPRTTHLQTGYLSSKVRSWGMTIVKDSSVAWNKLYDDAYGVVINTTYTLGVGSETFTVVLAEGIEEFTETGDMALQCQFIEYGG